MGAVRIFISLTFPRRPCRGTALSWELRRTRGCLSLKRCSLSSRTRKKQFNEIGRPVRSSSFRAGEKCSGVDRLLLPLSSVKDLPRKGSSNHRHSYTRYSAALHTARTLFLIIPSLSHSLPPLATPITHPLIIIALHTAESRSVCSPSQPSSSLPLGLFPPSFLHRRRDLTG